MNRTARGSNGERLISIGRMRSGVQIWKRESRIRNYIECFKRGYKWEKEFGAVDPITRALLSLLFLAAAGFLTHNLQTGNIQSWVLFGLFALGLVVLWVHVTVDGANWADIEEELEI